MAGIDVGNSTTEVVLLREGRQGGEVVGHGRALTRGSKGSRDSVTAAARLVLRVARRSGVEIQAAAIAPLRAVRTGCRTVADPEPDTAPLHVLVRRAVTAAGDGVATGRPVRLEDLGEVGGEDPVVVLADAQQGYQEVAERVATALRAGTPVVGVLAARDEAVLISNRLRVPLPVVDQVPVGVAVDSPLVALEARPLGSPLTLLTDPFWLAATFGLDARSSVVRTVSSGFEDSSYGVVALDHRPRVAPETVSEQDLVRWADGRTEPLPSALSRLHREPPGVVDGICWGTDDCEAADDVYGVHLGEVARAAGSRRGTVRTDRVVTALLQRDAGELDPAQLLTELLGVPVHVAESEVAAGRAGALSTPGSPPDSLVVDLGGGTVDASNGVDRCVVAGAGEMLTRVTAEGLEVPSGTAEHAKRGPALHAVAPQVVLDEKGTRAFLDAPAPQSAVGAVCVHGPVGLVPITREMGLGEWRTWRLAAKRLCLGRNVGRAIEQLTPASAPSLVLVGGAAGDDEIVAAIADSLPEDATVGRGNVAGSLGHRCAVAYGLAAGWSD